MHTKKNIYLISLIFSIFMFISCSDSSDNDEVEMEIDPSFESWTMLPSGTLTDFVGIHFFNEERGYVSGGLFVSYETTDGGLTWTLAEDVPGFRDFSFFDEQNGYGASVVNMAMGKTTDGGASWSSLNPIVSNSLWGVAASSRTTAHFVGTGGVLMRTNNGGQSFTSIELNIEDLSRDLVSDIFYVSEATGYLTGSAGIIKKSEDTGVTYETVFENSEFSFSEMHFTDRNTGYVAGFDFNGADPATGLVLGTKDAGGTWQILWEGDSPILKGVHFYDENNGIVVGLDGFIMTTNNGGESWQKSNSGVTTDLQDVRMLSATSAIVIGDEGVILKNQ